MKLRLGLFDLLVILIPAIAVGLGLIVGALQSAVPFYYVTASQSLFLAAACLAVAFAFHRPPARAFAGGFLGATAVMLALGWLSNQTVHADAFPTTLAWSTLWDRAHPAQAGAPPTTYSVPLTYTGPGGYSGFGMSGGWPYPVQAISVLPVATERSSFIATAHWATTLLLATGTGLLAKALSRSAEG
jgi:hypothetical protein